MTDKLPPAFEDLRDQLREAAARDIEIEKRVARRVRRGRGRTTLFVAIAAIVSVGGVAVAERAFEHKGPARPTVPLPRTVAPAADPGVIASSATPDPSGGAPWALRVFTNKAGLDCVAIGRLLDGTLGTYSGSGTFRPLPRSVSGACESLGHVGLLVVLQRRVSPQPRTIIYGLARDRQPVRVTIAGKTRVFKPGGFGAFIDVRAGLTDRRGATVSTTVGGRTIRQRIGSP